MCERSHMFALGCAVARAFPLYTRKNFHSVKKQSTITVEFCLKGKNNDPPTDAEITCLAAAADGIRLSAQIVDTPCNEMHTDAFVQVTCSSWGFYQRMYRYYPQNDSNDVFYNFFFIL